MKGASAALAEESQGRDHVCKVGKGHWTLYVSPKLMNGSDNCSKGIISFGAHKGRVHKKTGSQASKLR